MATYDDITLEPTPPTLGPGEKEHILVTQDECLNSTNAGQLWMWLQSKQQPLKKKGNGWGIHIPLSNPPPKPCRPDTHGQAQDLSYPTDHPNPSL